MSNKKKFSTVYLLSRRNFKIFLNERMAVIGSAIAPLIVLLLFVLFLKNTQINALKGALQQFPEFKYEETDLKNFINSWLITGVVSTAMITVPLGASTCLCSDNEKKISVMFSTAPVKPYKIAISYFIMVYVVSLVIVLILFLIGLAYVCGIAQTWIGTANFFSAIGTILVALLGTTLATVFIVSFIKTHALFQVINIIIGTTCGFIIGAYVPVSQFPQGIQTFCNIFPASSATTLIKNFLVNDFLTIFSNGDENILKTLREYYSCEMYFAGHSITTIYQWLYVGVFAGLMIPLNVWRFGSISKVKS